jgi:hypothetical protein
MASLFCGRPTKKPGRLCRWRINTERVCEAHGTMVDEAVPLRAILAREALMRPPEPPPATGEWIASKPAAVADDAGGLPRPVAERNIPGVCWWVIERASTPPDFDARWAGVIATLVRTLASLPLDALADEEKRDEAFLRGKILNGIPPETGDEWALAEAIFTDEALDELRSWNQLRETDYQDVREPLVFPERTGVQAQASILDHED